MKLFRFLKQIVEEFGRCKAGQMSAAFAYIAIFAIAPLLLVVISVAGAIFGEKAASGQLFNSLSNFVGTDTAKTLQNAIVNIHQNGTNWLALIVGAVGTLLAASGLTNQLQNSFDIILQAVPDPKAGIKRTVYVKLKNVLLLLVGSVAIIASAVVSALVIGLGQKLAEHLGMPTFTLEIINNVASLILFVVVLYGIYKILPDVIIPAKIVWKAALVVSVLFVVGKVVLAIIIGNNATASAYGAAASLVILMLWFYYTAQLLLIGIIGMKVYGENHRLIYKPKKYNLKRHTLNIDSKNDFAGELVNAFHRGLKKKK